MVKKVLRFLKRQGASSSHQPNLDCDEHDFEDDKENSMHLCDSD